ncbi:hypothetical protein K492DRAFT_178302 [Lichtheimia hyalospora FSU 10163]|nr:hypothetical protein K492DRAFT_178302 [Lichtheimia hyalospora FSU 10163]
MPRTKSTSSNNSLDVPANLTRDVYRHRAKQITAHAPVPYGTIPTRRSSRKKHKNQEHQHKRVWSPPPLPRKQAPYPYFENADNDDSTFIVSFFNRVLSHFSETSYADVNKEPSSPVGFMPRSPSPTTPLDVSVPITISRTTSESSDDACSCLSTSSSSSGSLSTSVSSASSSSLSTISENTFSAALSSSPTSLPNPPTTSNTTLALSDLLCDHYVQERSTATISTEKEETHDVENKGVPLETFRIFEAPSPDDDERWFAWKSPTDWTPILDDEDEDDDAYDNQSSTQSSSTSCTTDGDMNNTIQSNNNATIKHKAKSPSPYSSFGKKKPNKRQNPLKHHHARDIRVNSDHLRMIVAEANMMRAQKIVGPLRPRSYLPKRLDPFTPCRPSSLRY